MLEKMIIYPHVVTGCVSRSVHFVTYNVNVVVSLSQKTHLYNGLEVFNINVLPEVHLKINSIHRRCKMPRIPSFESRFFLKRGLRLFHCFLYILREFYILSTCLIFNEFGKTH